MARPSSSNDALQRIRRFYKTASIAPGEGGFGVKLDDRPLKTPGKASLLVPTEAAARMIVDEWASQAEHIQFAAMPATRHAYTAIDRIAASRAAVAQEVARYAGSDLLCYFADEPQALVDRQMAQWGPVLDWAEAELGSPFERTKGINAVAQPPHTLLRIEALALDLDDFRLAALAYAGALFGSSVLALALVRGRLSGEEAFVLSRLDEAWQEEQWGEDAEAAERTEQLRGEALVLEAWLKALA